MFVVRSLSSITNRAIAATVSNRSFPLQKSKGNLGHWISLPLPINQLPTGNGGGARPCLAKAKTEAM
jgi:hypothetical protein